jgi:hypothetical protein
VKVVALLSWYEEPASWLAETVASLGKFCDHVIAVDGPYADFPGALTKQASGTEQAETILHTAAGVGIGCTIYAPRTLWWGNEVQKRAFTMKLGQTFTTEDDWFFVIDADEVITDVPVDARQALDKTDRNVGEIVIWERDDLDGHYPARRLFRALRGITYQNTHYTITAPGVDGGPTRVLNGNEVMNRGRFEKAEDFWGVKIEHRRQHRSELRAALKSQYYARVPDFEHPEEIQ